MGSALLLGACSGGNDDNSTKSKGDASANPEELVQQSCISCHGGNLEGASAPALDKIGSKYNAEEIEEILEKGRGGMPAGILPENEQKVVATWLADKK